MSSVAAPQPTSGATRSESVRVAELFERHGRMVYGICRAMLRDAHEAEDATQQTFLSAYRALLGGARVRDSGAWIATIARNECRSRISAGMRAPLADADRDLADVPHGVDEVERRMQAGELRDALAELPERQREAVVLRYFYGLRYGEVAKALGLSRPATEALLFRARRAMRVRLRHAVGTALVVPFAVREELAQAIPGFEVRSGSGAAAVGITGGVLAKLASAPTAAKVATATVAISTVGAVGAVESDRPAPGSRTETQLVSEAGPEENAHAESPFSSVAASQGTVVSSAGGHVVVGGVSDDRDGDDRESRAGPEESPAADDSSLAEASTGRGGSSHGTVPDDESDHGDAPSGDRSTSGSSPTSSGGSGSSGPGSGEPETEEEDDSHDGSGSSGSGSSGSGSSGSGSDDASSSSGSGDEPDDELADETP